MSTVADAVTARSERRRAPGIDTLVVGAGAVVIALLFVVTTPAALHWFILPVTACAVLVGGEAIRWLRGRLGAFDPAGLIGVLGLYVFFFAPLLHVSRDYWMQFVQAPPDWRDWLGAMAILNCTGLIMYRVGRAWIAGNASHSLRRSREVDPQRLWVMLPLAMAATAIVQYWVYSRYGGIAGFVEAFETTSEPFRGMGFIFLFSESFPILAFFAFALLANRHEKLSSWWVLALVLLVFFMLKILFGGLRGSRSHTIYGLFWALGIIHLWIRPLPRRAMVAGIPLLAAFMFGYGFYKAAGLEGLTAIADPPRAAEIARNSGRTLDFTLLNDLGRADVQAFLLYRIQTGAAEDLAWGRTYVGGVTILIPRSVYPNRPPTKMKEGTDITHGPGLYESGFISTRVYGLAGEALLNVGAAGVPLAFLLWGVMVGVIRRAYYGMASSDVRRLMLPLWVNAAVIALISDSDNIVFFLVKEASVPMLVLLLCSRSVLRDRPAEE